VVDDPLADADDVKHEYGLDLTSIESESRVDSLVVAVGHAKYRAMDSAQLRALCSTSLVPVLGDLKAIYPREALAGFNVFRL
jgi:UDP-N-acetyl-D-glucosamine/UDP-N-acetyl-D-galactosamine dehydrogenase